MSISFRPLAAICMADLFDGRLQDVGVHEHHSKSEDAPANARCLTDGENFLWVYGDEIGLVSSFCRFFPNGSPHRILVAICDEFGVDIVSEFEPKFWGYETTEEWDAAEAEGCKAACGAHNGSACDDDDEDVPF